MFDSFFLLPMLSIYHVTFGGEGPHPGPSPTCAEMYGIVVIHAAEASGEIEERAKQGSTVIVHQFDQPGFLH